MNFRLYLAILCTSLFFMADAQQTINATIMHDAIQREFIVYVPANYTGTAAVPLLFNFHGYTSNADDQMWYGDFRSIADTAGFIIVHPQGTLDGTGTTHFNVGWGGSSVDDVGFTSTLIDTISAQYNINQDRIYSTGMSNGGFMSFLLACELSGRIAGIGSVTGSILPATLNSCNAIHSTPIIQFHGTIDGTVPYSGGAGWSEPIGSLVDYWANFNNCSMPPVVENVPNTNVLDGSTVEKFTYLNGDNCTEVIHYKITNGGHTWPGTIFNTPGTNQDINASLEIWNFLSQYDINGFINCASTGFDENIPSTSLNVYPNPAKNQLQIEGIDNLSILDEVIITDLSGAIVLQTTNIENGIDISELANGFYMLHVKHIAGRISKKFTKS